MEKEIFQGHGDHIDGIMPADQFVTEHIRDVLEKSVFAGKFQTEVELDEGPYVADVFALTYGKGSLRMDALIVPSKDGKTNRFVSTYPSMDGKASRVKIEKVFEWRNKIEATVFCSYQNFDLAFFAVDYFKNKDKYVVGNEVDIELAALGINVREAQREFSFEGQKAVDWLAKMGDEPTYDSEGNVEPVRFDMESLVAFMSTTETMPDMFQFQSPARNIRKTDLVGVDFFCADITAHRKDYGYESTDEDLIIPIYFRQDFFPQFKEEDPLSGMLWLTGRVS